MQEYIDIYTAERARTGRVVPRETFLEDGEFMMYVLALVENERGQFLITRRALDKRWAAGWWEVAGGGVPAGETQDEAVVREVAEETGLDVSALPLSPVYSYENVDPERGDNYIVDIYHFHLAFSKDDVVLKRDEAIDFRLATWAEISQLGSQGNFLHYERLCQALAAEGVL